MLKQVGINFSLRNFAFSGRFRHVLLCWEFIWWNFETRLVSLRAYLRYEKNELWITWIGRRTKREKPFNLRGVSHPTWGSGWMVQGSLQLSSLRADQKFLRFCHLACFCLLVPFSLVLKAGFTLSLFSYEIALFFFHFSFSLMRSMEISWSPLFSPLNLKF